MAPKQNSPKNKKSIKKRVVMDIAQKMKIIELLESGKKIASIARRFVVNESTIRTIRDNKDKIHHSATQLGPHSKFCKISRSGKYYCHS